MKTDDLIVMLASEAGPVESRVWQRRYALALGAGIIGAALLLMIMLNVRPDIAEVAMRPSFWAKLAFPGALAIGALVAAIRLSRPGVALGRVAGDRWGTWAERAGGVILIGLGLRILAEHTGWLGA